MFIRWTTLSVLAVAVGGVVQPPQRPDLDTQLFGDTLDALRVMQDEYFQPWVGTWPTAIDWTAAVMGTHVAGALHSLSGGLEVLQANGINDFDASENLISLYYSQLIGFYFGQDAFSLRNQAFDDMLWVVLGWLDAIKFAKIHSRTHYKSFPPSSQRPAKSQRLQGWHGNVWLPAFSHRARVFWHLASAGWDTQLCGGGMNWNPKLMPYKNAITNELYISASAAMYLHFPGDWNTSPYNTKDEPEPVTPKNWPPRDPKYKIAAVDGHRWLASSNMTNQQGLYADGFHISGYRPGSNRTSCDERDEMVYTYNQGTILTGLRELFYITGDANYLEEGHRLIRAVIRATGWNMGSNTPFQGRMVLQPGNLPKWYGLGRAGVLEDACDVAGDCSQDAQTFKGIWMHHFTTFCMPLEYPLDGEFDGGKPDPKVQDRHAKSQIQECKRYTAWLEHNANAARSTRDHEGRFGMWWTAGLLRGTTTFNLHITPEDVPDPNGAVDYRNDGVPNDPMWLLAPVISRPEDKKQRPMMHKRDAFAADVNNRGRGRTVETQSGGLALLRALWEISRLP